MDRELIEAAKESVLWTSFRLQMTIPSILAEGEIFALRMTIFGPDAMPASAYDRDILFESAPGIEGLPARVRFPVDGCGQFEVPGLRATGVGSTHILARPEGCPSAVASNPAWVEPEPSYRLYWGDLHVHTVYSNCSPWACKDPEFCYAYARDLTHLDFAAAADHLRGIHAEPERWPRLQQLARAYNTPGRFVSFLAFESSHKTGFGGDNNVYFLEDDAPYFWAEREDMLGVSPEVTLPQLWEFLDKTSRHYFTAPHHTGRAGKYRTFGGNAYDGPREPIFEIYSGWGSSESRWNRYPIHAGNTDEPAYFQDAIRAGCRYGVIGSSDDHRTLPGHESGSATPAGPKRASWHEYHGLAAVRAGELSREGLWGGLSARACYATTFSRTLLDLKIGDLAMGEAGQLDAGDPLRRKRTITLRAGATDGRATAILVRNGSEVDSKPWSSEDPVVTFEDCTPLEDAAIRDAEFHPEPFVSYYVRFEQPFDQTAWTSPIWLDL